LPEFLWPQAVKHTINVRNLTPKRQLAWKSPHEMLGRAVNLPERSILLYTKHLHTFGCEAYVRIPEEDSDFIKTRKTKERAREGVFVGTEGLRGHIYIVWVPEKNRLFRSRDVQFREEFKKSSKEPLVGLKETEESNTYRVTIPSKNIQTENPDREQQEQKLVGMDDESSTLPAGYRYATPESNPGSSHHEPENDADEIWYPADIDPEIPEEQNDPDKPEENPRKEPEIGADKPKSSQSQKGKEPEEPTRVSSRTNKGQNNNAFTKKHYTTYISFVAAQIAKQFVPRSLKEALEGPNKDLWYEACKKQLAKIEKKQSWELCYLPKGEKALPTKWVFDPKLRARLVVCGNFEKKSDVETFAAVVDMVMVKLFFLFVAVKDWECLQFNFEAAFLNG
jgi:hypothetical protein